MNLIKLFLDKKTLTIEDLKKKDICILCNTIADYYSLMDYLHKKGLRWASNDLPHEYIPKDLEKNNKPVYIRIEKNPSVKRLNDNRIILYDTIDRGLKVYGYQNIELV